MSRATSRLHVRDHGVVKVKPRNDIALRYIKTLFRNRCSEHAIQLTSSEFRYGEYLSPQREVLLTEAGVYTYQGVAVEVRPTNVIEYKLQKSSGLALLNKNDAARLAT